MPHDSPGHFAPATRPASGDYILLYRERKSKNGGPKIEPLSLCQWPQLSPVQKTEKHCFQSQIRSAMSAVAPLLTRSWPSLIESLTKICVPSSKVLQLDNYHWRHDRDRLPLPPSNSTTLPGARYRSEEDIDNAIPSWFCGPCGNPSSIPTQQGWYNKACNMYHRRGSCFLSASLLADVIFGVVKSAPLRGDSLQSWGVYDPSNNISYEGYTYPEGARQILLP
eukprot:762845-Hanusia_phi.AAC.4